jgi:hypothetical protein
MLSPLKASEGLDSQPMIEHCVAASATPCYNRLWMRSDADFDKVSTIERPVSLTGLDDQSFNRYEAKNIKLQHLPHKSEASSTYLSNP